MSDRREREERERIRKEDKADRLPWNKKDIRESPTIEQFDRCHTHGISYPAGGSCPKCR